VSEYFIGIPWVQLRGATVGTKVWSVVTLWAGIGVSEYFIGIPWVQLLLIAIGVAVTVHLVTLRTIRHRP
jgi:uncharacterized membrane protein YbaN (DUF454 family)